jgi:hypothetical protein
MEVNFEHPLNAVDISLTKLCIPSPVIRKTNLVKDVQPATISDKFEG